MDVCKALRINDTIFDGFLLPETIYDALIFFSTEITDSNNIPMHIKELQAHLPRNPHLSHEDIINISNKSWLVFEIKAQLDRNEKTDELKKDVMTNIFTLCIDNFDIYRILDTPFINVCKTKLEDIISLIGSSVNSNSMIALKAKHLRNLNNLHNI